MNYLLFDLEKRRKVPVSNITINKSIPLNTSQNLNRRALIVKHYLNQKYAYSMREMQNNKVEPVVPQIVDEPKHVLLKEAFVPPKNEIKGNITLDINEDIKEKKVLKTESKPNSNTESESEKEEYECIQFKPMYDISIVDNHRGGWNYLIEYLCKSEFYNQKSKMVFFDMVESYFLWNKDYICHNKWCGIVHCTSKTPSYLNECNISFLFQNKNLFQSLKNCFLLITLSPNVRDYLDKELKKMNYKIRVVTLKHPVVSENIPFFSMDENKKKIKKKLIQI
jgi:hypothetical protein